MQSIIKRIPLFNISNKFVVELLLSFRTPVFGAFGDMNSVLTLSTYAIHRADSIKVLADFTQYVQALGHIAPHAVLAAYKYADQVPRSGRHSETEEAL